MGKKEKAAKGERPKPGFQVSWDVAEAILGIWLGDDKADAPVSELGKQNHRALRSLGLIDENNLATEKLRGLKNGLRPLVVEGEPSDRSYYTKEELREQLEELGAAVTWVPGGKKEVASPVPVSPGGNGTELGAAVGRRASKIAAAAENAERAQAAADAAEQAFKEARVLRNEERQKADAAWRKLADICAGRAPQEELFDDRDIFLDER